MKLGLLLLLIAMPMLEIGLLIKAGQWLGFWWTLAVIFGTGMLGTSVLMRQGFSTPLKIRAAMLRGEMPVAAMLDGMLLALAGFLLITPGLLADAAGLVLLVPPVRGLIARLAGRWFGGAMHMETRGQRRPDPEAGIDPARRSPEGGGPVIEGEFERLEERTLDPNRQNPGGERRTKP